MVGYNTLSGFLMSCDSQWSVAPRHDALDLSVVCECGISIHTHLRFILYMVHTVMLCCCKDNTINYV